MGARPVPRDVLAGTTHRLFCVVHRPPAVGHEGVQAEIAARLTSCTHTRGGVYLPTAVARASWAAKRARERVRGMSEGAQRPSESAGEGVAVIGARWSRSRLCWPVHTSVCERIGPGGCGEVVPGRRAVVFLTELLDTYSIGPGERSRSVSGCRAAAFVTEPPRYPYRIVSYRPSRAGRKTCPTVTASRPSPKRRRRTRVDTGGAV